ncbi:MAG: peptidoglycan editing factor PgeF [Gammaproteobacteria bacterium]
MSRSAALPLLSPDWPAPPGVAGCFTTRTGGVSRPPYDDLNLALHVGDAAAAVTENRRRLCRAAGLAHEPVWLEQVHGARVQRLGPGIAVAPADAAITRQPGVACAVLVADCVPVLLAARDGTEVAAVHAGWRGLEAGVIAAAVAAFAVPAGALVAWLGPCIGPEAYAVGAELEQRLVAADPGAATCFRHVDGGRRLDLAGLARRQLEHAGVGHVSAAGRCVYREEATFFSYRRDGRSGRMAALVWIGKPHRVD